MRKQSIRLETVDSVLKMAAGRMNGRTTSESCTEDEISPTDADDLTPLKGTMRSSTQSLPRTNFRVFDAILVLISLITYLTDTLTDILVTGQYFQNGHNIWGGLTVGLIVLPSFITQCFSLRWYHADGKLQGTRIWLIHIFHLQPLERYIGVLMAGMDARSTGEQEKVQAYYYQQNDVSMLRLFETFLESAPQLTLQLYIMVATKDANWLTGLSAAISLVSVAWAVSVYNHALRQAHRTDYSIQWPSLVLHTLWHIGVVAARVCALVAFASLYKAWVFLFIGVHWLLMTGWVVAQQTDFCPSQPEERLFNAVVGVIYIFCFFSLKEGQTRWRLLFFYTVLFVENVILVAVWYPFREEDGWTTDALVAVIFGAFFLVISAAIFGSLLTGIGCMMLYYRFCHPGGPIYCCPPVTQDQSPTLPKKASGIYQLQVDLLPRTSTALLPRNAQLKPQTSLAMAAPPVVYKEVHTPSQLTPVRQQPGCRRVISYNETMDVSDTSMFRHYSIEASQCMVESRCATLTGDGIDLTQAGLDEVDELEEDVAQANYSFTFIDADHLSDKVSTGDSGCCIHNDGEYKALYNRKDSGCETNSTSTDSPASACSSDLTSGHGSTLSDNLSPTGSNSGTAPFTPRLQHHAILTVLPDFSPITDQRRPGTQAGCHKFPTSWKQIATLASTPHGKLQQPRDRPISRIADKKPVAHPASKMTLYAPLASPEVSLTESMCNLDDTAFFNTADDTNDFQELNRSNYDNVPSSPKDATVGVYLDNISGLSYFSQGSEGTDDECRGRSLSLGPGQTSPCIV